MPLSRRMDTETGGNRVAAVKTAICEEVRRVCCACHSARLSEIVLTGSVARDEGTWVQDGDRWRALGDVEFLLVFPNRACIPEAESIVATRAEAARALRLRGIECVLDFAAVTTDYFETLPPCIFAYELKECGEPVFGSGSALERIPRFSVGAISHEDGWRLLCNRAAEQLGSAEPVFSGADRMSSKLVYQTVKLCLDTATSLSVFAGRYAPTYRRRLENLRKWSAGAPTMHEAPFLLAPFTELVTACTNWKLASPVRKISKPWQFWEQAADYACKLQRWELERLAGGNGRTPDEALWNAWAAQQPLRARARAWAYAARARGWHRGWRNWRRWASLVRTASPRHWIYRAAWEAFLALPRLRRGDFEGNESERWCRIAGYLPCMPTGETSPQVLAAAIYGNYREFLAGTLS